MKYNQEQGYQRNHVIVQGREKVLEEFVNSSTVINGKRVRHKLLNFFSSNSEDALTGSFLDTFTQVMELKSRNTQLLSMLRL